MGRCVAEFPSIVALFRLCAFCVADADEEMLKEAKELLSKNGVKKVANLEGMDVKHIRFDDAPRAATLGFLKKAVVVMRSSTVATKRLRSLRSQSFLWQPHSNWKAWW